MSKIKIAIVDDEPFARKKIVNFLNESIDCEIIAEYENGREALHYLPDSMPDVVFLDIQMPELDGFEVLQNLQMTPLPLIVFVTAYDQYAITAFDHHALDYLLKPFDRERFEKTMLRIRETFATRSVGKTDERLQHLLGQIDRQRPYLKRLLLRTGSDIYFVKVEEIDWIEAAGNYLNLHTGRKTHLLRETMTNIEKKLDPANFVRIHRSQIVNLDRIKKMQSDSHGDYEILLDTGQRLTLTRTYRDNLLQRFEGR
ncbi:MAG: response regulator transcription factor [Deferribacteres bacterium]|nr:response regulator transcription factor [candidate division KSB1 bacterium]MCB9500960.1 response regulator transcription factor [Deferribacteres bacterium]